MADTVLIVEDDVRIAKWICLYFQKAGFTTVSESNGEDGLATAVSIQPELIILDLMRPGLDGLSFCKQLRKKNATPVIMLTARDSHEDKVTGLNLGADDYVTKPFDPDELVARARAVLRRVTASVQEEIKCAPFVLNLAEETATQSGVPLKIGHAQFKLLEVFVKNPNKVFTREQLIQFAFNKEFDGFDRAIDNHISRLRKLVSSPEYQPIKTVYGAGYRFESSR
jgi:two-component system phosphate regulon response regulator OmpR